MESSFPVLIYKRYFRFFTRFLFYKPCGFFIIWSGILKIYVFFYKLIVLPICFFVFVNHPINPLYAASSNGESFFISYVYMIIAFRHILGISFAYDTSSVLIAYGTSYILIIIISTIYRPIDYHFLWCVICFDVLLSIIYLLWLDYRFSFDLSFWFTISYSQHFVVLLFSFGLSCLDLNVPAFYVLNFRILIFHIRLFNPLSFKNHLYVLLMDWLFLFSVFILPVHFSTNLRVRYLLFCFR